MIKMSKILNIQMKKGFKGNPLKLVLKTTFNLKQLLNWS